MPVSDVQSYVRLAENVHEAARRLAFAVNLERLRDEMRRVKKDLTYDALASMIPEVVARWAPGYPTGGGISTQNVYDFIKLTGPHRPTHARCLAFHAFLMVVDEKYRDGWDASYFVKRAGLALTEFLATNRRYGKFDHSLNLQKSTGTYTYKQPDEVAASSWKLGYQFRCLTLTHPADMPFLLAYDFDFLRPTDPPKEMTTEERERFWDYVEKSQDLDARVGYYIPTRTAEEGVLFLNSFKWDWPTIYGAIFDYVTDAAVDDDDPAVYDLLLTDVNSRLNIDRAEPSYLEIDTEFPDNRKMRVSRMRSKDAPREELEKLLENKFDWGIDL